MSNWVEVTPSEYPWEQEALAFVRSRLPKHEPYRAWSNFEFIAGDSSINEVDLLVVSPRGMFLVEIKSWPERIEGDQGRWYRVRGDASRRAEDNPLLLANRKARRLKSLLERQPVAGRRAGLPFITPLVFLSHAEVQPRLPPGASVGVCVRDADEGPHAGGLPGIVATLSTLSASDRAARRFRPLATQDSRLVARAMEAAGIRPSRRHRRVGDYELGKLLEEGLGFQEYAAVHAALPGTARRVRVFAAGSGLEREIVIAAAQREFRSLDALEHAGILRPREYVETELGPALLYDREPDAVRLDDFLALQGERLDIEQRLDLVRQVAEAIAYAHAHGVVHRALAARSVLVCDAAARRPRARLRDWHTAHREVTTTGGGTLTAHLDELWQADDALYLAPEVSRSTAGDHLDVFSLGAIAFLVFTRRPPATSLIERQQHLDAHGGLDIAAVIDGANELLRACVAAATSPDVAQRTPSVRQFPSDLDEVLDELTEPEEEDVDPTTASKGDALAGYAVQARLGTGATAIAYLVETPDEERGSRNAGRRLDEEVERTEAQRLADNGWVEWGGELIWAVGFTSGGAPYGLRVSDFDPADLQAMGWTARWSTTPGRRPPSPRSTNRMADFGTTTFRSDYEQRLPDRDERMSVISAILITVVVLAVCLASLSVALRGMFRAIPVSAAVAVVCVLWLTGGSALAALAAAIGVLIGVPVALWVLVTIRIKVRPSSSVRASTSPAWKRR